MDSLIARLSLVLPAPTRTLVTEARLRLLLQFIQFGMVGAVGFVFDTATVYGLRHQIGLYGAGAVAYLVAATVTWALNRVWTFRGRNHGALHRQWALFLLANLGGFVLNRGTYAALVTLSQLCAAEPVWAVAGGSLAGMFVNFALSRRVVFKSGPLQPGLAADS